MSTDGVDEAVRLAIETALPAALHRALDAALPGAIARALEAAKSVGVIAVARTFMQRLCFAAAPPSPAPDNAATAKSSSSVSIGNKV